MGLNRGMTSLVSDLQNGKITPSQFEDDFSKLERAEALARSSNDNPFDFSVMLEREVTVTVFTYGDASVHTHKATCYKAYHGYLLIECNGNPVAAYNADQWIAVRQS